MKDYIDWIFAEQAKSDDNPSTWVPPWAIRHEESVNSLLLDVILTRLRTKEGLNLQWVHSLPNGRLKATVIQRGAKLGLELGYVQHEQDILRLVDPDGFLFSNELIATIFHEIDRMVDDGKTSNNQISHPR
jgi:hypothetical protein